MNDQKKIEVELDDANENWLAQVREQRPPQSTEEQLTDIVAMHLTAELGYDQAFAQLLSLGLSQPEAELLLLPDDDDE